MKRSTMIMAFRYTIAEKTTALDSYIAGYVKEIINTCLTRSESAV